LSLECVSKADLFRPGVTDKSLRDKIEALGKSLSTESLVQHLESFYDPPKEHECKDITMLAPDPCLYGKYRMPMSVPAITEVATAIVNLSTDAPEALQLQKCGGSKGAGKRLIVVVPSSDKKRLFYNAKQWMESIMSDAVSTVGRADAVKVLVRVLHTINPLAVEDAIALLDLDTRSKCKLDPELQQAMMCDANVNWSQFRKLKSCLCYSNLDTLQPESVMRELQVEEYVRPIPIEFREGKGNRK